MSTIGPQGWHPASLERRFVTTEPSSLDADVYQIRRVSPDAGQFGVLDRYIVWDCPDMTTWAATGEVTTPFNSNCIKPTVTPVPTAGTCTGLVYDNSNVVRSSVGVGLIWASPFGPLRFDYAVPLTKGAYDRVQQFKFGGGTTF